MKNYHKKRFENEKFRRSFYLLPNLCTALNMFCGFYAVIASINGKFVMAAYLILLAGVLDNLDGKIARATRSTSKFGIEFDSLADVISFGFAPGLMMYLWALSSLGRIGWLAAFLFLACGALRLARFNTQVGTVSSDHFVGLPIPAGAGMNAVTVLFVQRLHLIDHIHPFVFLALIYVLSFLMVSTIRYSSFKNAAFFKHMNFNVLVTAILILIFIAAQPPIALFLIAVAYVLSGPIVSVRQHIQGKRKPVEPQHEEEQKPSPVNKPQ
jgi:CDP-diacylglycerol--serine O-phosphatidyltransferase